MKTTFLINLRPLKLRYWMKLSAPLMPLFQMKTSLNQVVLSLFWNSITVSITEADLVSSNISDIWMLNPSSGPFSLL